MAPLSGRAALAVRERPVRGAARALRPGDPDWPMLLDETPDPPQTLWCRGDAALLDRPAVAVVGARQATGLGLRMGERLGAGLAAEGVVVVSGCAIGIDAAAHEGALRVGGKTVAVLGGGIDVAVPASNRGLARRIARHGCLLSEYPDGFPPAKHTFPIRNRIVAGLARVVVVVEAGARSGALITARHALDAGREVMAVPAHPMHACSVGGNRLLNLGARPVRDARDVLEELVALPGVEAELEAARAADREARREDPGGSTDAGAPRPEPDGPLRAVLDVIAEAPGPVGLDRLAAELGLPAGPLLAALTRLEVLGLVRALPGQRFARPTRRGRR